MIADVATAGGLWIRFLSGPDIDSLGLSNAEIIDAVQARGCRRVRAITSPVNTGSVAFHRRMGFRLEPGDTEADGVPVATGYDGPGQDRVRFIKDLPSGPGHDR